MLRIRCPYGQCPWEKVVLTRRSAQLAYDMHKTLCPYRKFVDSPSVEWFRCEFAEHGCAETWWFKRGARDRAAKSRDKHQQRCPHRPPPTTLPPSRPGQRSPLRPSPWPRHGRH